MVFDGIGNGGYSLVLIFVAFLELFGSGKLMNVTILSPTNEGGWYPTNGMMLLAPSAFLIGFYLAYKNLETRTS